MSDLGETFKLYREVKKKDRSEARTRRESAVAKTPERMNMDNRLGHVEIMDLYTPEFEEYYELCGLNKEWQGRGDIADAWYSQQEKIHRLQQQLKSAREVIEFYANTEHWQLHDDELCFIEDDGEKIGWVELGGKHARQWLQENKE